MITGLFHRKQFLITWLNARYYALKQFSYLTRLAHSFSILFSGFLDDTGFMSWGKMKPQSLQLIQIRTHLTDEPSVFCHDQYASCAGNCKLKFNSYFSR